MRSNHDMGGLTAGRLVPREHDYEPWEKRVDALMLLLSHPDRRLLTVDELRRNIESLGADAYDKMTYYERWMHAISQTLIQRGVISIEELGRKMAEVRAAGGPAAEEAGK
jgi:Nitrile hydratase beta subunit